MKRLALVSFLFFCSLRLVAQVTELHFNFAGARNGDAIHLRNANDDGIVVTKFRFYISNIMLINDDSVVWQQSDSWHLVDAFARESQTLVLNFPRGIKYNNIRFLVGVDSLTNTRGAGRGALDATRGMYWAWHSGYINLKLEGKMRQRDTVRDFTFHLGGFRAGENCERFVTIPVKAGRKINLMVDPLKFLEQLAPNAQYTEMTPGPHLVVLSEFARSMFISMPAK